MADRIRVRYSYNSVEEYEEAKDNLRDIIQQDTKAETWVETRSLPPIGFPPPLTNNAVENLKKLTGVNIEELKDED